MSYLNNPDEVPKKKKKKPDMPIVTVKTTADYQRMKLERLMANPEKKINLPIRPKDKNLPAPPEFVRNIMGSSAGAGSGEFHVYRHLRRKEYARQKAIQDKGKQEEMLDEFQRKLEENQKKAELKTAKNRAKRLKKKMKQAKKKKGNSTATNKQEESSSSESSSSSEDEKESDNGKEIKPTDNKDNKEKQENSAVPSTPQPTKDQSEQQNNKSEEDSND